MAPSGHQIGYARVSTTDQDTGIQIQQLTAAGCDKVFHEQLSGSKMERPELVAALDYLREGDTLIVTRIDRLARSLRDLQNLVYDLSERGISLRATEQPIDTSNAAGKAFLDMLGVFSEFETNLRRERQAEGIAKAKAAGKYRGRQPVNDKLLGPALDMIRQGVPKARVARDLGIGRATLYRLLSRAAKRKLT
jgi:DNA invertase Pin-like site-specific DNA recombinase